MIIADDLTGAMDTGVKFVGAGVRILVFPYVDRRPAVLPDDVDVIVVNTMSRHDLPSEASRKVEEVMVWAAKQGIHFVYKKTDATLRGNTGAELEAVVRNHKLREIAFLPAFPQMGRTVRQGVCYVNGTPLKDTLFARDPFTPVSDSRIRAVLSEQTAIEIVECGNGSDAAVTAREETEPAGEANMGKEPKICVYDGETMADLDQVAAFLKSKRKVSCTAGCSAFAQAIRPYLGFPDEANQAEPFEEGTPILAVCGSINEITLRQVRYAGRKLGYELLTMTPQEKLVDGFLKINTERFRSNLNVLKQGGRVLIRAVEKQEDMDATDRLCEKLGMVPEQAHLVIADHIGKLTAQFVHAAPPCVLILLGGDTFSSVLKHLDVMELEMIGEVLPGVVDMWLISKKQKYRTITKSGALGEQDIFKKMESYMGKEQGDAD